MNANQPGEASRFVGKGPPAATSIQTTSDTPAARAEGATMTSNQSSSEYLKSGLAARRTTKLALGLLATALIVGAGIPAFAGKPNHQQHGNGQEQAQEREQNLSTAARGKGKKKKDKTITRRFSSVEAIEIPDSSIAEGFGPADPYPMPLTVSGFTKARITDVNLTLRKFSHEFTADVDVLLVAPGGRNAVVLGDVGGKFPFGDVKGLTITLDDEAAAKPPVADDVKLTSGSFRPLDNFGLVDEPPAEGVILSFPAPAPTPSGRNALSTFDGIDPNGEWQLFILDDIAEDVGSLDEGWELEITASAKSKDKGKGKGKKKR
jgi:subtilisin-like proprotein convertase family protein